MSHRIVSWNCADNFDRKAPRLAETGADIFIVPEVRERHRDALGAMYETLWEGAPGQRGLLVAAKPPWRLSHITSAPVRHFALVEARRESERLLILGVWAMRASRGYVGALIQGLDALLPTIDTESVLVAGDFNASRVFDADNPPSQHFTHVSNRLVASGLSSLWHGAVGESYGHESKPTYYHRWKRTQPFHIDFMFASSALARRLSAITIGDYDHWRPTGSDHMPLIADFV